MKTEHTRQVTMVSILVLAVTLLYLHSLSGQFVWDDRTYFVDNDRLIAIPLWDLIGFLKGPTNYWGETLPLRDWLYGLQYRIFGLNTFGYHVVSLLLYLGCILAVFSLSGWIFRKTGRGNIATEQHSDHRFLAAIICTAIFAVHPVHVEAVAWISGQKELLYSLFSLLALILATHVDQGRRHFLLICALLALTYYAAWLSKLTAVANFFAIPLFWWFLVRKPGQKTVPLALIWLIINIPVAFWVFYRLGGPGPSEQFLTAISLDDRVQRAIRLLGAHAWLIIKPYPLNFGYPFQGEFRLDSNFLLGLMVIAAWFAALLKSRTSVLTVSLTLFLLYIGPALQLYGNIQNASVYDRYLFMPLLGPALLTAYLCRLVASKSRIARAAVLVLVSVLCVQLAVLTHRYSLTFQSNVDSLRHTNEVFPNWSRGAFDYAYALIEARDFETAEIFIRNEVSFSSPNWVRGYFWGWLQLERGELNEAIPQLRAASAMASRGGYYPFPDLQLARAMALTGQLEMARRYLVNILRFGPRQPLQYYKALKLHRELFGQYNPAPAEAP